MNSFVLVHSPDFRTRASSNASSCSRLSPIPALEPDWPYYGPEQLAGNLESTMRLDQPQFMYPTPPPYHPPPPPFHPFTQCPLHRGQPCSCHQHPTAKQVRGASSLGTGTVLVSCISRSSWGPHYKEWCPSCGSSSCLVAAWEKIIYPTTQLNIYLKQIQDDHFKRATIVKS